MDITVPFEEYTFRVYRAEQKLSVQKLHFYQGYKKSHIQEISEIALGEKQKQFFIALLDFPGILSCEVEGREMIVRKSAGFEWKDIQAWIEECLRNFPVLDHDLNEQVLKIIEMERLNATFRFLLRIKYTFHYGLMPIKRKVRRLSHPLRKRIKLLFMPKPPKL